MAQNSSGLLLGRRAFLRAGLSAAAARGAAFSAAPPGTRVIDAHNHLSHHGNPGWREDDRGLIDAADRLGIHQLACSILTPRRPSTPDGFRECNQWVADAMARFPGRILGYCYVNPGYSREACDEIRRCVEDRGFIGVKLYNEYFISEPVVRPVIELCIQLRVPILEHAGHPSWLPAPQPRISDGHHFSAVAQQYPEAMIICAHICGGGDWEWEIKALHKAASIHLDISGSVVDEGAVEMAARILGADRLLFACDRSMTASVGRLRAAELSETDKRKIWGENMQRILSRRAAA